MNKDQDAFLLELLGDFKIEAVEHRQAIVNGLLELEKNTDPSSAKKQVEVIFREIHSLKGAARAVNQLDIERLCMGMESVFHELKKENLVLTPASFDVLYKASDTLEVMLGEIDSKQKKVQPADLMQLVKNLEGISRIAKQQPKFSFNPVKSVEKTNPVVDPQIKQALPDALVVNLEQEVRTSVSEIKQEEIEANLIAANVPDVKSEILEDKPTGKLTEKTLEMPAERVSDKETVRVATAKLYNLLRQTEEMIAIKSTLAHYVVELQDNANSYSAWSRKISNSNSLLSGINKSELSEDVIEYLGKDKDFRKKHEADLFEFEKKLAHFQRVTSRMIDDLLIDIKTTLLHPFSSLLAIVPKIVRDLSKEYGKEIDLQIDGSEIEIDRRILEEIKDPLIHLIRNCIDHGIESPKNRVEAGKKSQGILKIVIKQDADRNISLQISDNGRGIQREKVISSAIKTGLIKPEEAQFMSDKEVAMLIFGSGVSTSPFITDISGRGLGMAIVAEKVVKLGGNITIESVTGEGSTFMIMLPQTLAIFRGILVKASEQYFIIPTTTVIKALRVNVADIMTVESKKTILFNHDTLALVSLSDVLNLPVRRMKKNKEILLRVLVISSAQKKLALMVDDVLGEHEGMIKDLGPLLLHITNIAGATLLGDGRIVTILHIPELIESASYTSKTIEFSTENFQDGIITEVQQKNILVAEDSITIRSMLRNFLESAGYAVKTAVDGQEAHGFLQEEKFDLVVSDIEMPHMTGFELTAKIREDKNLSDLPIVLVTALESADDRQRGMDLGANAYIVKSSFEQSNLVETIRRLI
ncbi:MAG: hybrid sensor histidine kinase/response regulator [Bacteroidales bacterium]